jgi:hypothetical protein
MYSSAVCPLAMASDPAGADPPKLPGGVVTFASVTLDSAAAMASCPAASSPMTSSAVRRPAIITPASTTGMTTSSGVWYRCSPGSTAGSVS